MTNSSLHLCLSLTRGKVALDVASSKFLLLDSAASSPAALPAHLRPLGEFKGTCRDVELADSVTFRLILTTGKLFEAKVSKSQAFFFSFVGSE